MYYMVRFSDESCDVFISYLLAQEYAKKTGGTLIVIPT